jgi:hypothetical protein
MNIFSLWKEYSVFPETRINVNDESEMDWTECRETSQEKCRS